MSTTQENFSTNDYRREEPKASKTPMVRLEHVYKIFPGGVQAVKDMTVDIPEGEVFTLLGPSGCGKTTTLRMVAGLETPEYGNIYLGEKPVVISDKRYIVPPHKRNIGMVFQSYAIWPHMTVEENVSYPLKLRHIPRAEIRERVGRVLELVGLAGYEKRPAPLLSGGQQQRVAVARALVYEPHILLLDEPFSNLDTKLREQMRMEVKLLQQKLGLTIIFVTHDQIEALSLSDRIAVMNFGEVQQMGGPHALYEQPANAFVRDFLGKTVLLKGKVRVANAAGKTAVEVDGSPGCLVFGRSYNPQSLRVDDTAYIAMRPEDIQILPANGSSPPEEGLVAGTVETMLFVGERSEFRIAIEGQTAILVYGKRQIRHEPGDKVWLKVDPESAAVWSADVGALSMEAVEEIA